MNDRRIAVFAPWVCVTVTIEEHLDGLDEIHIHAGGQGIWVARMLRQLGERPTVCAPIGGESGLALQGLTVEWGIDLRPISTRAPSPIYVHDRRSGQRCELARTRTATLSRHEADELYNAILELALAAKVCVVTGRFPGDTLPPDFFRRLGADLGLAGVPVVADLHGPDLDALLTDGPIRLLKISEEDLVEDGLLDADCGEEAIVTVADELVARGVEAVVVSRSEHPVVARLSEGVYRVSGPVLQVVDATGSGDSMTAALTVGLVHGHDTQRLLRTAWAAGAANVTRRGLGSASAGLIAELADHVTVERLGSR